MIIVFYTLFLIPILHTFYFNFLFIILSSMTFPPLHGLFYLFSHVKTLFFEIWICITLIIKYHFIYLTILLYTEWDPNLSTLTSIGFLLCNLSIGPFFLYCFKLLSIPYFFMALFKISLVAWWWQTWRPHWPVILFSSCFYLFWQDIF